MGMPQGFSPAPRDVPLGGSRGMCCSQTGQAGSGAVIDPNWLPLEASVSFSWRQQELILYNMVLPSGISDGAVITTGEGTEA